MNSLSCPAASVSQEWIGGYELDITDMYGMRKYTDGAILIPHVDRQETHAVSMILNIDQRWVVGGGRWVGGSGYAPLYYAPLHYCSPTARATPQHARRRPHHTTPAPSPHHHSDDLEEPWMVKIQDHQTQEFVEVPMEAGDLLYYGGYDYYK